MATETTKARVILAQREWVDGDRRITVDVDEALRMMVVFYGKGSVAGAHAICELVDSIRDELGHDRIISALVDMRRIYSAPLRAQAIIGRWLMARKHQIARIAIFGGGRLEMAVAKAVMTIAGMGRKAHFGAALEDALRFLEFPEDFAR